MFGNHEAIATVGVRDMAVATEFYENVLGLARAASEGSEAYTYEAGSAKLIVYRSQFAGTNQATSVTWNIGSELEAVVKSLADRGVKFEHYDMPPMHREGDIHIAGNLRVAWFKDPDGNIHSLFNASAPNS
jgi:catechol 2,3-dioxygenase-like lactoylglutathione lyase family enzyme